MKILNSYSDVNSKIAYLYDADLKLSKVIDKIGIITIHYHNDPFTFLVHEIIGQMLSSSVARIITERLSSLCEINPNNLLQIEYSKLREIGISKGKVESILQLSKKVESGELSFESLEEASDEEVLKILTSFKGIGNWTAKMYLLFYLQRDDVLPFEDGAFLQAYRWLYNTKITKPESIARRCKKWKPYSSIAARYMYRALDTGLTKISIKKFLNDETSDYRQS